MSVAGCVSVAPGVINYNMPCHGIIVEEKTRRMETKKNASESACVFMPGCASVSARLVKCLV
jgi:hypothetical protein